MKNERAISMISMVITILLIIIIASISGYYIVSTIDNAQYKDAKEEVENVENVVEYAKTQILINQFMPNDDETNGFVIKDSELETYFGNLLSTEEKEYIKQVNASDVRAPYKFYLMDQNRFDEEFGNEYNVTNLRPASHYLVNYMDVTVVCNYGGMLVSNQPIIPATDVEQGEISIVYTPNGNIEWKKAQETMVNVSYNSAIEVTSMKYLWSQNYTEPSKSEFGSNTLVDGQTVSLDGKTGNDWYLWVYVEYKENGREKTDIIRSEPFYIDNTPPTGTLEVEEISM